MIRPRAKTQNTSISSKIIIISATFWNFGNASNYSFWLFTKQIQFVRHLKWHTPDFEVIFYVDRIDEKWRPHFNEGDTEDRADWSSSHIRITMSAKFLHHTQLRNHYNYHKNSNYKTHHYEKKFHSKHIDSID